MIVTLVPINCRPAKLVQNSGNNCEKLAKCMSDHVQLTLTNWSMPPQNQIHMNNVYFEL